MGVNWTKEQQKVIKLRARNILVSAAAGSGKTAVLVERIITMLTQKEDPVSVDQLLIVTFTEAAAAEMKERIHAAIEKRSEEEPDNEHLRRQATLIHNAQITTIHSFCLSVIRDHFPTIDLDPGFRIGEEGELKLLRHEVLGEVLEEAYDGRDEEFLDFVAAYGSSRGDKKIEELILRLYEFSRSYPDARGWLYHCVQGYEISTPEELEEIAFVKKIMQNIKFYLNSITSNLKNAIEFCKEPDGPKVYENTLKKNLQNVEELLEINSFQKMSEKLEKFSWGRFAPNRDEAVSEWKVMKVKEYRDAAKMLMDDVQKQYFYQGVDGILEDLRICCPKMKVLADLVLHFAEKFEIKKREKEMIDFSDMEQYALRILTKQVDQTFVPSGIAQEYQKQFREIMIDEYQDSNLIQETILTSISTVWQGKNNIFMVGDVKQSIYRFRLSRPELFMEKFRTYDLRDSEKQRIDLHKNFRSRREVLESTNYIFEQIMTQEVGGISYDKDAALYVGAEYPENPDAKAEVLLVDVDVEETPEEGKKRRVIPTDRELEAKAIAGRIKKLVREYQVVDKKTGQFRPCRYSDIVILTRTVIGYADVFAKILNEEGIPAYSGMKEGYFETQEIGVLLDYLRVLDNEKQDLPLTAVLTSVFGNLSETELAMIRSDKRGMPFHEAVAEYRRDGEDRMLREKLEQCLGMLEHFRACVPYTPMHELLRKIVRQTGYGDYIYALPGGQQRRLNLEMLSEKAKVFESSSYKGLFHFVRYIEQLQKYNVDYGEASLEDEQADTIRIMTIHKSKGLEFPVVFVSGMGKRFNMQDVNSSVVLHASMGVGLDAVNTKERTKCPSLMKKVIQGEERMDSLGEELRVLYVALTRAKEKLIITGSMSGVYKKLKSYEYGVWFGALIRARNYWDWILPAISGLDHNVPMTFSTIGVEDLVKEEMEGKADAGIERAVLEQWNADVIYDETVRKHLKEQFGYRYPYENSRNQKLKFTVSELKKRAYMEEILEENSREETLGELLLEEPKIVPLLPKFLQEEGSLTGASRGTAYHRVMELLDFGKMHTQESLRENFREFVREEKLTKEMAASIRIRDILTFLQSPIAERIRECAEKKKLFKEQPFVLGVDAREIYPGEDAGESILIQGIIDMYFEEPDGLVVVDYKTDHVRGEEELKERYRTQLDYYARALEQVTEKKVKEKIIYSFALGKEILLN